MGNDELTFDCIWKVVRNDNGDKIWEGIVESYKDYGVGNSKKIVMSPEHFPIGYTLKGYNPLSCPTCGSESLDDCPDCSIE